jgi:hypothetical protein
MGELGGEILSSHSACGLFELFSVLTFVGSGDEEVLFGPVYVDFCKAPNED